jgi:antitoxin PrlF
MTFQEMVDSDEDSNNDRPLGQFLSFLERDIHQNPQHLQSISSDLVNRIQALVAGVDIDLDAPLADELEDDEEN